MCSQPGTRRFGSASLSSARPEIARWTALLLVGAWLLHPFVTDRMIGAGDARWYLNMLADFVTQLRQGVFPIFVGQTEFAFNGAIYPLRVAPLYQHWAGLLDLITGQQLGFITLQHLVVLTAGFGSLFSCYLCLRPFCPSHPWTAAAVSVLYASCPAVLGLIYTQDMYMSWIAMPFLPLVFCGTVNSFRTDSPGNWVMVSAGLALLWLSHAPIAFWASLLASGAQFVRLTTVNRSRAAWIKAVAGAVMLAALGSYPFVSLATLHDPAMPAAATSAPLDRPELIVRHLESAFPGALLPLSAEAGQLSDLQLGYGLLSLLLVASASLLLARSWILTLLVASAWALMACLLPIPGWSRFLWLEALPEEVRRLSYYWPMQRLYPLIAATTAFAGLLSLETLRQRFPKARRVFHWALALACAWGCWEGRQFVRAGAARTATAEHSAQILRPENLLLMNHAYGLFAALPAYFSHGVVDPYAEARLLHRTHDGLLSPAAASSRGVLEGTWDTHFDPNAGVLNLKPALRLEPNRRYELHFDFPQREFSGVLQIMGTSLFREYMLPSSGEALAFGSAPGNHRAFVLWSTRSEGEEVNLRFVPSSTGPLRGKTGFGEFSLVERGVNEQALKVTSLAPFTARIHIDTPARLETPRMYLPGYTATVNEAPTEVTWSAQLLATVDVPAGASVVRLTYEAPLLVRASYWISLISWVAFIGTAVVVAVLRLRRLTAGSHVAGRA